MYSKKTSPVNTLTLNKHVVSLSCSKSDALVVLHTGNTVWVYNDDSVDGKNFFEIPVGDQVSRRS